MKKNACVAKQASRLFDLDGTPNIVADFGREKGGRVEPTEALDSSPFDYAFLPVERHWVCARVRNGCQRTQRPVKIKQHAHVVVEKSRARAGPQPRRPMPQNLTA
jgi:hypothetical protein